MSKGIGGEGSVAPNAACGARPAHHEADGESQPAEPAAADPSHDTHSTAAEAPRPGQRDAEARAEAGVARDNAPAWLMTGENLMRVRCDLCPALGPWGEGADHAEAAALAAGWRAETDDELDEDGNLVCRTVRWLCPGCKA